MAGTFSLSEPTIDPLWEGVLFSPGCLGVQGCPPPWPVHPRPPAVSRGALKNACHPDTLAWARITCWATAVRWVSERRTTSACHSATVCQCMRRDVTLACAKRRGPGWGCMSLHRSNSRRGRGLRPHPLRGGEGGAVVITPAHGGGCRGVEPSRGLVVPGRTGARAPTASCAPLPFLAPARGAAHSHLRGSGGRGRRPCLPHAYAGRLHGVGEVAATQPHGGGLVDGGARVRPRYANPLGMPPLRGGA